ncbi:MAG TPA: glycosyltransferase family 87 protein [Terracidiphilus sp.]|nr:glycosyltransferase family 87 protein [Terracidiphilus sp.]
MTQARSDGIRFLLLGIAVFLLFGFAMSRGDTGNVEDFRGLYLGTRTLLAHHDPYNAEDVFRTFLADGGRIPEQMQDQSHLLTITRQQVYPPTLYLCITPMAMFGWTAAKALWTALTALVLILGAVLTSDLAAPYAPVMAGILTGFLIANCEVLFAGGNPAGLVIGLCAIAVWCFHRQRFEAVGVFCLAISLSIKPHDTGLVWLYLLLAGGSGRKRALQTLAVAVVLAIPALLWVGTVSPHWLTGLRNNLAVLSADGGLNAPGPATPTGRSGAGVIDLQAVVATFDNHAAVYNAVSYAAFAGLFLLWLWKTLRLKASPQNHWLALAVVSSLTLLPIYHRPYDAKLLLLSVPACAMLWAAGGRTKWFALSFTFAAFLFTADVPLVIFAALGQRVHAGPGLAEKLLLLVTTQPAPLSLFAMTVFYLWVYFRQKNPDVEPRETSFGA